MDKKTISIYFNALIICLVFLIIGMFLGLSLKINSQSYWDGWNDGTSYLMDLGTVGSCKFDWTQKETPNYCDCIQYAKFKPERYSICKAWKSCENGEECSLFWGINPLNKYK